MGQVSAAAAAADLAGKELDYVQFTALVSVTATTAATADTIVTGNAVAFDGATVALIEFFSFGVTPRSAANGVLNLYLYEDGASIGRLGFVVSQAATGAWVPVHVARRMTPSNGSHTYSIRAAVDAGTGQVDAGAGGPAANLPGFIRITRVAS